MIEYILQFGNLNRQQIELIKSKELYFCSEEIPKQVGFVMEGVIGGYYHSYQGEELSHIIIGWHNINNKMVQLCMYQKSRKGPVISPDATTRYLVFMENDPSLTNCIPFSNIASYLGVTQQSLSSIRKNIH